MTERGKSIYKACREQAGLTQEDAAERLNCSVRSLARYESGEAAAPDDIAYRMAVLYDSQYLAVEHLRQASQVAARVLPPLSVMALPVAVIRIINRVREFAEQHRDTALLQIAEDGVISDEERPLFEEIMAELDEIIQSSMELKLSEKGDHHGTGEGSIPGQPGAHSRSVPRQRDHHPEGAGRVAAHGCADSQGGVPHEGRRRSGRYVLDLRGQPGPGNVVRAKKDRPDGSTSKRPLFRTCVENDCKIIIAHPVGNASPNLEPGGGVLL